MMLAFYAQKNPSAVFCIAIYSSI